MKPWWQVMQMGRIMEEFDDNGGGGGGGADDLDDDGIDDSDSLDDDLDGGAAPGGGNVDDDGEPKPAARVPAPVPATVDPKTIEEIVRATVRGTQSQQPPQMSDEEFRKMTDYYAVNGDFAKQFAKTLGIELDDERAGAFSKLLQGMIDGANKHALKTAGLMQGQLKEELSGRVVGLETRYQKQQAENFINLVTNKYTALSKYREILPEILNAVKASGAQPKTTNEAVKLVAKAARDHIRKYVPNFMSQNAPGSRKMAGSLTGGGASTGGFGAGGQSKSKASSLPWD